MVPHAHQALICGDQWRECELPDGSRLLTVHGPSLVDSDALAAWMRRGCTGGVPVRQGFVAILHRTDGSVVAAVSSRMEIAAYWAVEHDRLLLSVHLRDLVRALDAPPALDLEVLADLMVLHDERTKTTFVGVNRLPLGHQLTWTPGDSLPKVEGWFRPLDEEPLRIDPRDAAGLMRETVREAVAASLPENGDVAATLSGGLDSSMVVGTAAKLLHPEGRTIHALTSVPLPGAIERRDNWIVSDGPDAEQMCREVPGLTWTGVVNAGKVLPLETLFPTFERTWRPILNPSNTTWITELVGRAGALSAPLLLTGATGNGPFSRDRAGVVRTLLRQHRYGALLREPMRRHAAGGVSWGRMMRSLAGEVGLGRLRPARAPSIPLAAAMPVCADRMDERRSRLLTRFDRPRDPQKLWVDLVLRDASMALVGQDLSETVWWSDPLCDPQVVTLALRLPSEAWLQGGVSRGLAREAARGIVPDHIRLRHTRGAQSADLAQVLRGRKQAYRDALDILRASQAAGEFIDLNGLANAVEHAYPDGEDVGTWAIVYDRAFGFGLFAAWYEGHVLRA